MAGEATRRSLFRQYHYAKADVERSREEHSAIKPIEAVRALDYYRSCLKAVRLHCVTLAASRAAAEGVAAELRTPQWAAEQALAEAHLYILGVEQTRMIDLQTRAGRLWSQGRKTKGKEHAWPPIPGVAAHLAALAARDATDAAAAAAAAAAAEAAAAGDAECSDAGEGADSDGGDNSDAAPYADDEEDADGEGWEQFV